MTGTRPFFQNLLASELVAESIEFQEWLPKEIPLQAENEVYRIRTMTIGEHRDWSKDSIHELAKIAAGFQRLNLSLAAYQQGICMDQGKVYLRFRPELFKKSETSFDINSLNTTMGEKDKEIFRLAVENYSKTLNFSYLNLAII